MSLALVAAAGSCSGSASSGDVQADTLLLTESEVAVPYDVLRMPYALTTDGQRLVVGQRIFPVGTRRCQEYSAIFAK